MTLQSNRRSHPHPRSRLSAHARAVAGHIRAILATNLTSAWMPIGDFLADTIGLCHDLLKDTDAFQMHLDGRASDLLSRHTGGGAVLAYLCAREILRRRPALFEASPLRLLLPHIAFAVVAAHHGELKQTDIDKEHTPSLHHWQKTRGNASLELIGSLMAAYEIDYAPERLDQDLAALEHDLFDLQPPFSEVGGEDYFCAFLLCKMCLGAIAWADADSAARQTQGAREPETFIPETNQSRIQVTLPPADSSNLLNQLRTQFQNRVCENWRPDFPALLLKAPTGLGKTVAASRLAATIQRQCGDCKVFYLAPTTAILNQVAEEIFSYNLNDNNMLLHYLARELSDTNGVSLEKRCEAELIRERAKRFERLDAGLVVTTYHRALTFLGGVTKNRSTALFNLRNSLWILDECQFLSHIQFGVFALICSALNRLCGAMPVFMSATPQSPFMWRQAHKLLDWPACPELTPLLTPSQLGDLEQNDCIDGRREIFPCARFDAIERLTHEIRAYREEHPHQSVLVLVNLAKDAVAISQALGQADYTITNYLRPGDIKRHLADASRRLAEGEPVLMIATSIVQAGVDLDFDAGFVELNDLRCFRQGCGRVGRNFISERGRCPVFAFDLRDHNQRSSWFRQRFHRMIRNKTVDAVTETYQRIIAQSIAQVLQSPHSLSDSDIEAIENQYEKEITRIFETIQDRLLGFPPNYDALLQSSSGRGFDFKQIEQLLTDDLSDNESASPFLVVFTTDDGDAYDQLMQSLDELKTLGKQIKRGEPDFFERLSTFRNLKKRIFRHIAPFSLRRMDVLRDFEMHFEKRQLYEELDFYLVLDPACYEAATVGWMIDSEVSKESEGQII